MTQALVELLEKARACFVERGGAVGTYKDHDTGRVCAIGALEEVAFGSYRNRLRHLQTTPAFAAKCVLNESARLLFGDVLPQPTLPTSPHVHYEIGVATVNDHLGKQAVLDVYDHAIKTVKEA